MVFIKKNLGLIVIIVFIIIVSLLTFFYPPQADDFCYGNAKNLFEIIKSYQYSYFNFTPRLGSLFAITFASMPKIFFNLLNPIVQTTIIFFLFYLLFERFPKLKDKTDGIYLLFISCLYLTIIASPSQTILWLTGAVNYSWMMLLWLILLSMLYPITAKKKEFYNTIFGRMLIFILAMLVGLSNENNSVLNLALITLFIFFYKVYKKLVPKYYYLALLGSLIGFIVLFLAPGNYAKLNYSELAIWKNLPFIQKFTLIPLYVFSLIIYSKYISILIYFPMIHILIENSHFFIKNILNNKSILIIKSVLFYILAQVLVILYFVVFLPAPRAYFSATLFILLTSVSVIIIYTDFLKNKITTHFFITVVIVFTFITLTPGFIDAYYLSKANNLRQLQIKKAKSIKKKEIYLSPIRTKYRNYIIYYDID